MESIFEIPDRGVLLFDGGIGTQLQLRGLPVGESPEKWNLENPDAVKAVHQAYMSAGADFVTTNSFGGSPFKLKSSGLEDKAREINYIAAAIAKEAVDGSNTRVAGSVGPTGAMLLMGDISEEQMLEGFALQVEALKEGGADVIIIETMSDLDEASVALKAARQACKLPVIVSMTFEPGAQGFRTMMGVDIETAATRLTREGADVLGTNCGVGIDNAVEIVKELRRSTKLPLLAEPNAGLPQLKDGQTIYMESPEMMAERLPALIAAGASIVGGCCGTTPEHTALFRERIDAIL